MPLPVTNGVTLYSTQVLAAIAPLSSVAALVRSGRVFQLRVFSAQELLVVYTAGPSAVAV